MAEAAEGGSSVQVDEYGEIVEIAGLSRPAANTAPALSGTASSRASSAAASVQAPATTGTALFQRGCERAAAQEWAAAADDLKEVLRKEPENEAARRELERVMDALREEQGLPARADQARESEEAIKDAEAEKAEGTRLFQAGRFHEAAQAWRRGADLIEDLALDGLSEELSEVARKLAVALYSNAAQALLKCPEVEGATTKLAAAMADKALELEPTNIKALFRRGVAYANAEWWFLAQSDLAEVLQLDPKNEAARRELKKVEARAPPKAPLPQPGRGRAAGAAASASTASPDAGSTSSTNNRVGADGRSGGCQADSSQAGGSSASTAQPASAAEQEAQQLEQAEQPEQPLGPPISPEDVAEVVRKAQKESERFRKEILSAADRTGRVGEWCQRFNRAQMQTAQWVKHQLADAETVQDLLVLRGPVFAAMDAQQREDFLCAYEFVQEVRESYGEELARMF